MGLISKSSQPAASAFSREPDMACAVNAMMGMPRVTTSALSRQLCATTPRTASGWRLAIAFGFAVNLAGVYWAYHL